MSHRGNPEIEKRLIAAKLSKLREYLKFLKELQATPKEKFIGDFKIIGATERYLQTSIECIIDIGNEIISTQQLQRPECYRDIPTILAKAKIIPKPFAETIAAMIGFRNLLVHDYASINIELVYEFLQTRLSDFETFIEYIVKWLNSKIKQY
jgi:uncharacterized protein YutE (UPF0331/DUF86 family)